MNGQEIPQTSRRISAGEETLNRMADLSGEIEQVVVDLSGKLAQVSRTVGPPVEGGE